MRYLGRFLRFLAGSGNRYAVHSPYLYNFIDEVFRQDSRQDNFRPIERLRKDYLSSKESLIKTDYGRKTIQDEPAVYQVQLSSIARGSVTSPASAHRLHRLAKYIQAENMLEIGTSLGLTTAYLALANSNSQVITLEGCPELCRMARENHHKLNLPGIEVIEGRFEQTLPEALAKLGKVDLVYIDGNHHKDAMIDYFEKCLPCCHNGTVMVFDDIHASRGMEEAWADISGRKEVTISLDLFFSGWVIFRKESSKQHFKLRYF